jgi:hypothetical protein
VFEIAAGGGIFTTLGCLNHADRAYPVGSLFVDALVLRLRAGNLHGAILSQKAAKGGGFFFNGGAAHDRFHGWRAFACFVPDAFGPQHRGRRTEREHG